MLRLNRLSSVRFCPRSVHAASFCSPSKRREPAETEEEQTTNIKVIYEETSSRNIRAMMFATGVNLTYWGFNSSLTIFNNIQAGVPLGFGTFDGAELDTFLFFASSILVGATKLYADHSVMKVYENLEAHRYDYIYIMYLNVCLPCKKVLFCRYI